MPQIEDRATRDSWTKLICLFLLCKILYIRFLLYIFCFVAKPPKIVIPTRAIFYLRPSSVQVLILNASNFEHYIYFLFFYFFYSFFTHFSKFRNRISRKLSTRCFLIIEDYLGTPNSWRKACLPLASSIARLEPLQRKPTHMGVTVAAPWLSLDTASVIVISNARTRNRGMEK